MMTIRNAQVGLYTYVLDKPMGGSGVSEVDVIVCKLRDADGVQGFGFSYVIGGKGRFVADRAASLADQFLSGAALRSPQVMWREIVKSFNRTGAGINFVALAALDVAVWDLQAHRARVPLGVAMGGEPRTTPVYASSGFAPGMDPRQAVTEAQKQFELGYAGVKPRVSGTPADATLLSALADVAHGRGWLMADMNEKGDLSRARWMLDVARDLKLFFVEEPLPAFDAQGLRQLASVGGTTIATGEHLQAVSEFASLAVDRAAGILQPDLAMVGGLTPCLQIANMAETLGLQVMPHFLPSLFTHLAAASPAITMLEDFPLLEPIFSQRPHIENGQIRGLDMPGHGLIMQSDRVDGITWL